MLDAFGLQVDSDLGVVILAVLFAGFLRGFVGFGAALVVVPILSLVYGPIVAIPAASVMSLPATALLLPDAIRHSEPRIVVPISIAIFICAPLGMWTLVSVDPQIMKVVISVLVVGMVMMLFKGWKLTHDPGLVLLSAAGAVGGLIQGAAGIGGPPVVAVALSRAGPVAQQRANIVGVMTAISLSSFLPLWHFGLLCREAVTLGLVLFAPNWLATWVGAHYFSGGGKSHYRVAALTVLALIGFSTLVAALRDFAQS